MRQYLGKSDFIFLIIALLFVAVLLATATAIVTKEINAANDNQDEICEAKGLTPYSVEAYKSTIRFCIDEKGQLFALEGK